MDKYKCFKDLGGVIDRVALAWGIIVFLLAICLPDSGFVTGMIYVAGVFGLAYVVKAVRSAFNMVSFDWSLIHGNFLRKVCCLVILLPFLITLLVDAFGLIDSPKELAFEEGIYEVCDKQLSCDVITSQESPNVFWTVYYHFLDPGNQHMTTTPGGRILAALIAILGVFMLNGLLVSSIIGWVDKRKEQWLNGGVRYDCILKRRPHYVIIGGNDMVPGIVLDLMKITQEYILIQTSRDVQSFRRELFSNLTEEQQQKVIIYYGNRNSVTDIADLKLDQAKEVYILGEETRTDDIESYHDTMNMECLKLIHEEYSKYKLPNSLLCRVMFEYQTTFSVFQFSDIDKDIDFRPFNYYEMWAQKVFVNRAIKKSSGDNVNDGPAYLPLEGLDGIREDSDKHVHLFVVGMSRMGVAMAIEAAHLAHYPNYEKKGIRTKITFIDKNAAEEKDFFIGRFKELFTLSHWRYGNVNGGDLVWDYEHELGELGYLGGDFIDVEWEFINGGLESEAVQDYITDSAGPDALVTIAICLPESNRSHAAAMYLSKEIYSSENVLQVLVYNRYGDSIINALHLKTVRHPYLNKMKPFGMPGKCFDIDALHQSELIGKAVGDRYKVIQEEYIAPAMEKAHQPHQQDLPGKYKGKSKTADSWSNIYNGNMMWTKLRCIGYDGVSELTPDQIESLADVEHNRWNIEQLLMHFRPLTIDEQMDILSRKKDKDDLKGEMAHLNICSNERLLELKSVDVVARAYDVGLTTLIPEIYAELETDLND